MKANFTLFSLINSISYERTNSKFGALSFTCICFQRPPCIHIIPPTKSFLTRVREKSTTAKTNNCTSSQSVPSWFSYITTSTSYSYLTCCPIPNNINPLATMARQGRREISLRGRLPCCYHIYRWYTPTLISEHPVVPPFTLTWSLLPWLTSKQYSVVCHMDSKFLWSPFLLL